MRRMKVRRRDRGWSRKGRKRRVAMMATAGIVGLGSGAATIPDALLGQPSETVAMQQLEERRHASLLTASDALRKVLMEEEGVRYTVYRAPEGNLTVGVGHLVEPEDQLSLGDRIGEGDVLRLLRADLAEAEAVVGRLVGDLPLTQHEFDALVELAFNVGEGTLLAGSPRLNAAVSAGDYDAIAEELDYSHAGGEAMRGLALRSERRAGIFLEASYETPARA